MQLLYRKGLKNNLLIRFVAIFALLSCHQAQLFSQSLTLAQFKRSEDSLNILNNGLKSFREFRKYMAGDSVRSLTLVHPRSFNQVVKQDVEFTILGDGSTVSGSAIDISSKTSAKVTFRIPSKRGVFTGELEAGQKDENIPLVVGGKYKGELTGKVNFTIIPVENVYGIQSGASPSFARVFENIKRTFDEEMIDSLRIIACIAKHLVGEAEYARYIYVPKINVTLSDSKIKEFYPNIQFKKVAAYITSPDYSDGDVFPRKLAAGIAKQYVPDAMFDSVTTFDEFMLVLAASTIKRESKLLDDFRKILVRMGKRAELMRIEEIKQATPYWTTKRLTWLTFTPSISYKSYSMFGMDKEGSTLVNKTTPFVTPKFAVWLSHYRIYSDVAILVRGGVEGIFGNNLKDFKEVKYHERDTLQIGQKGNVVISEKITDGLYREQTSDQEYKAYVNVYFEYYLLPKKDMVPGLVAKASFVKDGILDDDVRKIRPELGMVINLYNKDKKNTYLTIQPYFRFDNLRRQTKLVNDVVTEIKAKEKMGFGILLGLPIRGRMFATD